MGTASEVRGPGGRGSLPPGALPPALASLPPGWSLVTRRDYGPAVYRVGEGPTACFVKVAPANGRLDARFDLVAEAERMRWLRRAGLAAPEVVAAGEDDRMQWLVTAPLPGEPAARRRPPEAQRRVADGLADYVRALHALDPSRCPFDRTLPVTLAAARRAVADATVDLDDLEPRHAGWTGAMLLAELEATPPPPEREIVVCHGDLTLDNVVVDPETLRVTGVLDLNRLGRADRWLDLAVLLRSLAEESTALGFGPEHAERFLRRYGAAVDPERDRFYRLLDEFN